MLTPEARHFVKLADLDWLEQFARRTTDEIETSSNFEDVFAALDKRPQIDSQKVLDWGQRYIAWASSFPDRDSIFILGTSWARRLFDLAIAADRPDLALAAVDTVLASYAPLEKERNWWMKQQYQLKQKC